MPALCIDHVHVEVSDRKVAAAWFAEVLGLIPHDDLAVWAEDPMGPLILATADGTPTLSLFARKCDAPSRDATIAFRFTGSDFLSFRDRAAQLNLRDASGAHLPNPEVIDHELSWSIYFYDPDGNRFEVTTYDYAEVSKALRSSKG